MRKLRFDWLAQKCLGYSVSARDPTEYVKSSMQAFVRHQIDSPTDGEAIFDIDRRRRIYAFKQNREIGVIICYR